jgi:hypothetical protein
MTQNGLALRAVLILHLIHPFAINPLALTALSTKLATIIPLCLVPHVLHTRTPTQLLALLIMVAVGATPTKHVPWQQDSAALIVLHTRTLLLPHAHFSLVAVGVTPTKHVP